MTNVDVQMKWLIKFVEICWE